MKQRFTLWTLIGSSVALMAAAMLIGGCGGGGGAAAAPPGPPASFVALLPAGQAGATLVGADKCGECHDGADSNHKFTSWQGTVHATKGVSCESCHGPGSKHVAADDEDKKLTILTFPKIASALVCAQCHSKDSSGGELTQHDSWLQSGHREPVTELNFVPPDYSPGLGTSDTCTRCHNAGLKIEFYDRAYASTAVPIADRTARIDFQKASFNEGDSIEVASSASCASCHDPHAATGNMVNDEGKDLQIRRKPYIAPDDAGELAKIGPGASVTNYTSFNHICAQCHNGRGADGRDAKLQSSTGRPGMHDSPQFNMLIGLKDSASESVSGPIKRFTEHATAEEQCIHCHMADDPGKHSFVVKLTACSPCHNPVDAANRREVTQNEVTLKLLALRQRLDNWGISIDGNRLHWQYSTEEYGGPADQSNTNIPLAIKRARNNYYYVVRDASFGVHNAAYTRYLIQVANEQLNSLSVAAVAVPVTRGRSLSDIRAQMLKEAKKGCGE